ncbi:MAG: MoxR family ATPase [Anaerolineales bacterium]|nr:MoxR family ATPase [Anaerolineales bacterium]
MTANSEKWLIFKGDKKIDEDAYKLLNKTNPPWRTFGKNKEVRDRERGKAFFLDAKYPEDKKTINLINAALYLRRPLLVTGKTGIGKSSLAYAVAYELGLGEVLTWPVSSHSTIKEALYEYDPIGRMRENTRPLQPLAKSAKSGAEIDRGKFFTLRALGTALANKNEKPRVLLIDELDKSDMDLPNNLLHVLEEGEFMIDELVRNSLGEKNSKDDFIFQTGNDERLPIKNGRVNCQTFPFVVITSNREREFPKPFLRRCIRLDLNPPSEEKLTEIVKRQFQNYGDKLESTKIQQLITQFFNKRKGAELANDQLLNAIYLYLNGGQQEEIIEDLFRGL